MFGLNQWQSILFSNHPKADEMLANMAYQSRHIVNFNVHQDLVIRKALLGDRDVMVMPSIEPPARSYTEKWAGEVTCKVKRKRYCITDVDEDIDPNIASDSAKKQKSVQFDKISHQIGGVMEDPSAISAVLNESARESFSLSPNSQLSTNSKTFAGIDSKFLIPSPGLKFLSSKSRKIDVINDNIKAEINLTAGTSFKDFFNSPPSEIIQTKSIINPSNKVIHKDTAYIVPPKVSDIATEALLLHDIILFLCNAFLNVAFIRASYHNMGTVLLWTHK